jgi:hypothetical protein
MGANGIDDFKKHPFFAGTDWKNLKSYKAPFCPQVILKINYLVEKFMGYSKL